MPPPIVEGRVSEAGGAGAAFAQVTLAQGDHVQVVRTRPDGWFRFRAFQGAGTLTVKLPQGWTAPALTREVGPALRGDVIRADFLATARRVLRGGLLVDGAPLREVRISAGPASASPDARGLFVLEGLRGGVVDVRVDAPPLAGRVELPAGPADVARDVSVSVPDFGSLRVSRVPQDSFERPISDWLASKRLGGPEVGRMERLPALVGLERACARRHPLVGEEGAGNPPVRIARGRRWRARTAQRRPSGGRFLRGARAAQWRRVAGRSPDPRLCRGGARLRADHPPAAAGE